MSYLARLDLRVEAQEAAKNYKSLNDASAIQPDLAEGTTEIWYAKSLRDLGVGYSRLKQRGLLPQTNDLKATHILLGRIKCADLNRIYGLMQGEIWSPQGESRNLISSSGLSHTGMSVGDIVKIGQKVYMVDMDSFKEITASKKINKVTREPQTFRDLVEAKYNIVDAIKAKIVKVLKYTLPALVLFSATTGFAKVKEPEALGKHFQEIASDIMDEATVKTHVLQNDDDQPQVIVYTLKTVDKDAGYRDTKTATIKYIEGKGATLNLSKDGGKTQRLAEEFKGVLNSLDTKAKDMAKKNMKKAPVKQQQNQNTNQMAWHAE